MYMLRCKSDGFVRREEVVGVCAAFVVFHSWETVKVREADVSEAVQPFAHHFVPRPGCDVPGRQIPEIKREVLDVDEGRVGWVL